MTSTNQPIFIQEFTASQQATLFQPLKQSYYTGHIQIRDSKKLEYVFYFYLGRVIYATGGSHKTRRWRRHVNQYCPNILLDNESISYLASTLKPADGSSFSWEYLALDLWIREERISREQLLGLIRSLISEVLLDLSQSGRISYVNKPYPIHLNPAVVIDVDQVIVGAWKMWQDWQSAKLGDRSPNLAPVLKKPEELKLQISADTYRMMVENITGEYSLRELSLKFNRNVIALTKALMVYVQLGLIELKEIPDILPDNSVLMETGSTNFTAVSSQRFLIGCVDDSPMVLEALNEIIQNAGHDFVSVSNSLHAFATFIARKPDLIFLDLIMPATNGYELCASLRKLSVFRRTPIIMLTQNANILDRMKGKMSGFNDFLSKPVNRQDVLNVIHKHLIDVE